MKKFTFSLQSLLDIKETEELHQINELKNIENKLTALLEGLNKILEEISKTKRLYKEDVLKGIHANKLVQYNLFFDLLNRYLKEQKKRIAQAEAEKEKCMKLLLGIRKEIKSLEKLYEIELEEHKVLEKRQREKEIDDIVTYKVAIG